MNYPVKLEGFEGQTIEVQPAGFFSVQKLLVNGQPASSGKKRGEMVLRRNDGQEVTATWKPQFAGLDIPQLVVEGKTIQVVEPLKWYEWAWSALPVALIFIGGALGGITGVVGLMLNAKVFRSDLNGFVKFAATGVVSLLAVAVYFVTAVLFLAAIGR
jgi:hypothetical protein